MLGLPNCFDSHEKESASMFECFRAVELCVKCLTKRDKVWVNELMLIMLKTILLFPKAVDFSLPMHSFGFLVLGKKKKNRKGAKR